MQTVRPTIDHVAIAVPSIETAIPFYELLVGGTGSPPEDLSLDAVRVSFIGGPGGSIELLEPLGEDSPVARFLGRRGPGLHHVAFRVADLAARLRELRDAGVRLIDETPRAGAHGRRVAFIHPGGTGGVLVELVEATPLPASGAK